MPHCVIECTDSVPTQDLLTCVFDATQQSNLFADADIKVRIHRYSQTDFFNTMCQSFIHVTIYMLAGRTTEQKQLLARSVESGLLGVNGLPTPLSISVNLIDMDRNTYRKQVVT